MTTSVAGAVERLEWDSDFFGVPIGRVDLGGLDAQAMGDVRRHARALGIVCLYGLIDPALSDAPIALAQRQGFQLMEVALDLDHRTSVVADPPPTMAIVRQGCIDDLPALGDQLASLAPWSRFAVDPRFGLPAARRMHEAWVARAASGQEGRVLAVAEVGSRVTGILTMSDLECAEPCVDLVVSSESGSGAAQALLEFAFSRFGGRRSWLRSVAARNVVSLRFYENAGYRVARSRYQFHLWLDEGVR